LVTQKPKRKLTYEDYAKTPEGERWELIDGELIMPPSPKEAHQSVQGNLGAPMLIFVREKDLGAPMLIFVREKDLGKVYFAPFDVVLSDTDTVQPDLLFVSKDQLHIITADNVQGAPDLVVEIRSPSTARQDWTTKRELYARHGVKEYWLVDPEAATVAILLFDDGELKVTGVFGEGESITSTVLEGFSIALADIFLG
jgi:Uma2 family endonuclease